MVGAVRLGAADGSPYELISASRDVWTGRSGRVSSVATVRLLDGKDVIGLLAAGRLARVTGVAIRSRSDGTMTDIDADLVVDASGRNSHAPAWLVAGLCPGPGVRRQRVSRLLEPGLCTAGRVRRRLEGNRPDQPAARLESAGVLFPLNGGLWHVTLVGTGHDYPPTDEPGFIDFARSLRSPVLHDAIADAKPLTSISGYRRTQNRSATTSGWRPSRWVHRARRRGLRLQPGLRTGDERRRPVGSRTPGVVGRGGTSATFQKRLARAVSTPWLLATSEDSRFPTTKGGRPGVTMKLMHRYIDRVMMSAPLTTSSSIRSSASCTWSSRPRHCSARQSWRGCFEALAARR